jgi:hypothetical protein
MTTAAIKIIDNGFICFTTCGLKVVLSKQG